MDSDKVWSGLFAVATAILMLGILLLRTSTPPLWALLIFPTIGASLAHLASRTSPNRDQNLWLESSTIAAACVVLLVLMVNAFMIDLFLNVFPDRSADQSGGTEFPFFILLAGGSAMLWWALERRLRRMRQDAVGLSDGHSLEAQANRGSASIGHSSLGQSAANHSAVRRTEELSEAARMS